MIPPLKIVIERHADHVDVGDRILWTLFVLQRQRVFIVELLERLETVG